MEQHELWRHDYHGRRYMEYLTPAELEQRAKDVFLNFLVLTEDAKIGAPQISSETIYWLVQWTHVLEEFATRYGPYPGGFTNGFMRDLKIPDPRFPLAPKAAAAVRKHKAKPGSAYLVKYGKLQHMRAAIERGELRISPGSYYNDPSLNYAMRDDELRLWVQVSPNEIRMEVIDSRTRARKGVIRPIRNVTISRRSETNYYVYCLSRLLTPRLFLDFNADACLLITRPDDFVERILRAVEKQLPEFAGVARPVTYFDPLNASLDNLVLFFSKHFRYAYQKEFRLVWLPESARTELAPITLELGSLEDCCEMISLIDA